MIHPSTVPASVAPPGASRESEALLRAAFEHAPVGVAICDQRGVWVRVNAALSELTGYSEEELLALGYRGITHPDDAAETARVMRTMAGGATPAVQLEKRYIHRSGRVLRVLVSIAAVNDAAGAPVAFITQIYDITARSAAEDALRASVERFQALAELAPVGIFQTDPQGRNVYVNRRLCEMTGWTAQDLMGDQWARAVHPDDRERTVAEWLAAARAGTEYRSNYRFLTRSGEVRWLIGAARPLRSADGSIQSFLGTVTDISQLKAAEERLLESLAVQEAVVKREAMLLRELNHRVRNNLAGLQGLLKIYERTGKSGAELAAAMRAMIGAMTEVHDLISRAPGGPVVLSELVQRTVAPYRHAVRAEGPEVQVPAPQAAPLAMVLQELLTNSVKHGALSVRAGRVSIAWKETRPEGIVRLIWSEHEGPPVRPPASTGVGLPLVEGFARLELRGNAEFEFSPDGFSCILSLPSLHKPGSDHAPGPVQRA